MAPSELEFGSRPQLIKYAVIFPENDSLGILNRLMRLVRGAASAAKLTLRETDQADDQAAQFDVEIVSLSSVEHDQQSAKDVHFAGTTAAGLPITGYVDITVVEAGQVAGHATVGFQL